MPYISDVENAKISDSWAETTALVDNALATATHAAKAAHRHFLTRADASYSNSQTSGLLTVKRGTNVLIRKFIHGHGGVDLGDPGLLADSNEAVSAELAASGVAGTTGCVVLAGFTVPG